MASLPSPNNLQDPSAPQNPKSPQSHTLNPLKQTFAATLNCDSPLHYAIDDLPSPFVDYGIVSLRISEEPYLRGINKCKTMLIGSISPSSKASPLKSHELVKQLRPLWSSLRPWTINTLGKGFFALRFQTLKQCNIFGLWVCDFAEWHVTPN